MTTRIASLVAVALAASSFAAGSAAAGSTSVVVSEVYGGGGNTGAPYDHDFIELANVSSSPVDLTGWSVQYASATGTSWSVTALPSMTLPAGKHLLVQEGSGGTNGSPLPTADATGTTNLATANGKVALVAATAALSGGCPTGRVDLVGYGTATCSEGSAAPAASNTLSVQRKQGGIQDSDDNSADFQTGAPAPQNAASPTAVSVLALGVNRFPGALPRLLRKLAPALARR